MKILKRYFLREKIAFSCLAFAHHEQGRMPNYDWEVLEKQSCWSIRKQAVPPPSLPRLSPPIKNNSSDTTFFCDKWLALVIGEMMLTG